MAARKDTSVAGHGRSDQERRRAGAPEEPSRPRRAEETPSGPLPSQAQEAVGLDVELEEDLGAELEFRGDVLEAELEAARRESAAHLETAQRLKAEFENYRKRVAREQEDAERRAGQRIVSEILPAIDNLERALAHAEESGEGPELASGVRMVLQQLLDVLAKEGVEPIDPKGAPFDPHAHQAVGQAHDPEVPDGTVVEVYLKGYRMYGRVLRPAMVVVSTGGPAPKE